MRRFGFGWIVAVAMVLPSGYAYAQNSLDALEQELNEAKQQHQDVTSQTMANFFSQLESAMASPDAAVALYQQAGGVMPNPTLVVTEHESETETEKETRLAADQANLAKLGMILQLHCGLMKYGALLIVKPDQKGLQEEWVAWLQKAAQMYPLANVQPTPDDKAGAPQKRKRNRENGTPPQPRPANPFNQSELKSKSMHDSIISKYLGFKSWGDKEQGTWAVQDLPKLFKTNVLDPSRATPTAATLTAWDAYIAMANADEKDDDKWTQVVYPPLQFDRAYDDYAVLPSTEKIETLVNLIKANPTFPTVDEWITRTHKLVSDYRAQHGGSPDAKQNTPTNSGAATNPNVSVTTEQEGDATIITTHTNSTTAPTPPSTH